MSYRQIFYQIVFGTKNRQATIEETYCEELYKYIWGMINKKKCKLYRINGVEDHIHIFSDLHPTVALADYIKDITLNCVQGYLDLSPSGYTWIGSLINSKRNLFIFHIKI